MLVTSTPKHDRPIRLASRKLLVLEPVHQRELQPLVLAPGKWTIGSHSDCTITLSAEGVRSHHCLIVVSREQTIVKAWDKSTWVNDGPVQESELRNGDRIAVGPVEFRIREATSDDYDFGMLEDEALRLRGNRSGKRETESSQPYHNLDKVAQFGVQAGHLPAELLDKAPGSVASPNENLTETTGTQDVVEIRKSLQSQLDRLQEGLARKSQRTAAPASNELTVAANEQSQQRALPAEDDDSAVLDERIARLDRWENALNQREAELDARAQQLKRSDVQLAADQTVQTEGLSQKQVALEEQTERLQSLEVTLEEAQGELKRREEELEGRDAEIREALHRLKLEKEAHQAESTELSLDRETWEENHQARNAEFEAQASQLQNALVEIEELRTQLSEVERNSQTDPEDLSQREKDLEARFTELRNQHDELVSERDAFEKMQAESEGDQQDISAERERLALEAETIEQDRKSLETAHEELDVQRAALEEQQQVLNATKEQLQREEEELEQTSAERSSEWDTKAEDLSQQEASLEQLNAEITEREAAQQALQESLTADRAKLDGELIELQEREAALEQETEAIAEQFSEVQQKQTQVESQLAQSKQEREELAATSAELEARAAQLNERDSGRDELESLEEERASLHADEQAIEDREHELLAEREAVEHERSRLNHEERQVQERIEELNARESQLDKSELALEARLAELETREKEFERRAELDEPDPVSSTESRDDANTDQHEVLNNFISDDWGDWESASTSEADEPSAEKNSSNSNEADDALLLNDGQEVSEVVSSKPDDEVWPKEDALEQMIHDELSAEFDVPIDETPIEPRVEDSREEDSTCARIGDELDDLQAQIEKLQEEYDGGSPAGEMQEDEILVEESLPEEDAVESTWPQTQVVPGIEESEDQHPELKQEEFAQIEESTGSNQLDEIVSEPVAEAEAENASDDGLDALRSQLAGLFDVGGDAEAESHPEFAGGEALSSALGAETDTSDSASPDDNEIQLSEDDLVDPSAGASVMSLETDDSQLENSATQSVTNSLSPESTGLATAAFAQEPPEAEKPADFHLDDAEDPNSVAAYMERLLARTRHGQESDDNVSAMTLMSTPQNPAADQEDGSSSESKLCSDGSAVEEAIDDSPVDEFAEEVAPESIAPVRQQDHEAVRAKLDTMRQLANFSARSAIAVSTSKRMRGAMVLKAALTVTSLSVAAVLLTAELWGSVSYRMQGYGALALGAFSAIELLRSTMRIHRLRAMRDKATEGDSSSDDSVEE